MATLNSLHWIVQMIVAFVIGIVSIRYAIISIQLQSYGPFFWLLITTFVCAFVVAHLIQNNPT